MHKSTPVVTAVVCAYNAEEYIRAALVSLCEQTYDHLEILVIDDASTDRTAAVVAELQAKHPRIRLIRLERNGGIAHARQTGLLEARTEWMLFLDADDIALPTLIERQLEIATSDLNILGVSTYSTFINSEGRPIGFQKVGITTREQFFHVFANDKLVFVLPTTLFSRSAALAVGGYRLRGFPSGGVRYQDFSEDVDLWCRMADLGRDGKYFITIPEPLFHYRKTAGSLSTANVFRMQNKMRWIKDCLRRRRSNLPERPYQDFLESIPALQKANNLRVDAAAFLYKQLGFCYLRRQYVRMLPLGMAVLLLSPKFLAQKLKMQTRSALEI